MGQNEGDSFFGNPAVHEIRMTFSQPSFWDSLTYYYPIDRMMPATVEIDGVVLISTGVQLKGNSSYNSYPGIKKPMNLDFNEYIPGQNFDGLKKLNLNNGFKDPTLLREKLFLEFCHLAGVAAPRCTFAKLYINGTYWGLYTAVEQVNKTFLNRQFSNNEGNLFKGDPSGRLVWKGTDPAMYYPDYELKTNESANDWSDLIALIDRINNSSSAAFHDSLEKVMDTESYLRYWACNIIFSNLDSYTGSGHNYYLYHDTITGKFRWIMWDVNEAFGNFNMGLSLEKIKGLPVNFLPSPPNSRPLSFKMLTNALYETALYEEVCRLTNDFFTSGYFFPLIDSLADAIRADYHADPNKMFTNQQFEDNLTEDIVISGLPGGGNIAGLKSFILARRDSLSEQLAQRGCYLSTAQTQVPKETLIIYPNPADRLINIYLPETYPDVVVEILGHFGEKLMQVPAKNARALINISHLCPGIYLIKAGDLPPAKLIIVR